MNNQVSDRATTEPLVFSNTFEFYYYYTLKSKGKKNIIQSSSIIALCIHGYEGYPYPFL